MLFLDLVAAPPGIQPPAGQTGPSRERLEHFLMEQALRPLLGEVSQQRAKEVETISRHIEISLNAIIDRVQLQFAELFQQKEAGSTEPGIEGRLKQFEDRLDELNGRLEQRRRELQQERQCTVADIQLHGRAWALPHPERTAPAIAPMVRDDEIERMAVEAVIAYEQARGWQVVSVELEDKGFDLISRRFHPEDPQTAVEVRFIEVKGRAGVGDVALTGNEYRTAQRLGGDYWLYVVYNCAATPEVYPLRDPATLLWAPLGKVAHYYVDSQTILAEAQRQRSPHTSKVEQAFREVWGSRLAEWGEYNILVEGVSDKLYLEPLGLSITHLAQTLGVSRKAISTIVNQRKAVTPEMALRLSRAFNTTPELWLNLQKNYDLWYRNPMSVLPDSTALMDR